MEDVKTTVDDDGRLKFIVTHPKQKAEYYVQKSRDGFVFYEIKTDKGRVPDKLSGRYTKPERALSALQEHLRTAPVSTTVQRDNRAAKREKAKQDAKTAVQTGNDSDLQQRTTD